MPGLKRFKEYSYREHKIIYMTEQEILEGNYLMSDFLMLAVDINYYLSSGITTWHNLPTGYGGCVTDNLRYHKDWNWIMSVVEKIESFHLYFHIETHGAYIEHMGYEDSEMPWLTNFWNVEINNDINDGRTKIDCTWLTCVQFIKWYNNERNNSK